jgi:sulfoxide reductase heme-binding subunit YedZ
LRRSIALGFGIGLGLLLVFDAVVVRLGLLGGIVPRLSGASPWIISRAAGVTAYLALTLDVIFGLLVSTAVADRLIPRGRSVEIHRWLSSVTLALTAVHGLALLGDRFIRFDAFDVLVPFLSPHRAFAVGLGVLAAYGALAVHVSFWLRRRIGTSTWRKLHYVSFFVFAGVLGHGILAGSDSAAPGMRALYIVSIALVASLGLHRALASPAGRTGSRRSRAG